MVYYQSSLINFIEVIFSETPLIKFISLISERSFVSIPFYIITIPGQYCMARSFCSEMVFYFSAEKGWWDFFCIMYFLILPFIWFKINMQS